MKTAEEIFYNKLVHYNPILFPKGMQKAFLKAMEEYANQFKGLNKREINNSLPTLDLTSVMSVKISEMVKPPLTEQEQAFFIAGFCECVKWLGSNKS